MEYGLGNEKQTRKDIIKIYLGFFLHSKRLTCEISTDLLKHGLQVATRTLFKSAISDWVDSKEKSKASTHPTDASTLPHNYRIFDFYKSLGNARNRLTTRFLSGHGVRERKRTQHDPSG
jgi:hypothetical protein